MTFAASAVLILGAKWVPAFIIDLYNLSIFLAINLVEPLVTLITFDNFLFDHLD